MNSSAFNFNQTFDSDDEDDHKVEWSGRDGTIVLVDCACSMFVDIEDEMQEDEIQQSRFLKVLSVLENVTLNRIISNDKDLVSTYRSKTPQVK